MVCAKITTLAAVITATCLTPQQIAEAAGVSVNVVYRMRRGHLVRMDAFGKVCKALGVEPALVIDFDRLKSAGRKAE